MKKLFIYALLLLALGACKEKVTTYYVVNNYEGFETIYDEYLDGTLYEVVVFCYEGENIVKQDNLEPIPPGGGSSEIRELPEQVERLVVSFQMVPKESAFYDFDVNDRVYTVTEFLLNPGEENEIVIDGKTMMRKSLLSTENFALKNAIVSFD